MRCLLALAVILAVVARVSPGLAMQSETDAAVEAMTREVASQLRCPVCQGLSIEDSPTELAQEMRDVIRDQLAAGKTPEEVRAYFVSKYGEWVLLEPKPEGFNLAVYFLPVVALFAGGGVIVAAVRRWTRQGAVATVEPTPDQ